MTAHINWGILGTGRIAGIFAEGLAQSTTGTLVAVASRTQESADAFAQTHKIEKGYATYDELLADPEVDAVYLAMPHPMHAEWAIKAADAGKHILCEKPMTLNHPEGMAVVEAAHRNDVFLMEAFMYRCHPQTARLVELVREGSIGDVRVIESNFSFNTDADASHRLISSELGGGGILDVGCYAVSMARLLAGAATGKPFADPIDVHAAGHIDPRTGTDAYAAALLRFEGDILAQVSCGVRLQRESSVRIWGTQGNIRVPSPWFPGSNGTTAEIIVERKGQESETIHVEAPAGLYTLEADTVAAHLDDRQAPTMPWADSLGNLQTLDRLRAALKLVYPQELPENQPLPVHKRPLRRRDDTIMRYGQLPGITKPVSRLVLGVDNQRTWPLAAVMLDDFFERGGNCFDSAFIYGSGECEKILGQWIATRDVRSEVVILDKGAHTPYCTPEDLTKQHHISLERLQTDYVDMYMMHRDNTDYPVSAFIDVLNEHRRAGTMHAFGASNWSFLRVQEANDYARANGLEGFSAVSNNFSLARMVAPPWAGCISASDRVSRAWLTETQIPLMPWSSQARGFFTGRARPDDRSDEELVRCWYSDDNFQRLERVNQLAQERGVLPINIALAYVLNQPFPTFPLIGPRALVETRTSFPALQIELALDEVRWLNLE